MGNRHHGLSLGGQRIPQGLDRFRDCAWRVAGPRCEPGSPKGLSPGNIILRFHCPWKAGPGLTVLGTPSCRVLLLDSLSGLALGGEEQSVLTEIR